jgi:hypothetical protein
VAARHRLVHLLGGARFSTDVLVEVRRGLAAQPVTANILSYALVEWGEQAFAAVRELAAAVPVADSIVASALFAGHNGTWADNMELEEESLRVLEAHFERLPIPDCPMWTDPSAGVVWRWYAGPSVVLREDANTWVWVLAQTRADAPRGPDAAARRLADAAR